VVAGEGGTRIPAKLATLSRWGSGRVAEFLHGKSSSRWTQQWQQWGYHPQEQTELHYIGVIQNLAGCLAHQKGEIAQQVSDMMTK
jgi:hypothetical protein